MEKQTGNFQDRPGFRVTLGEMLPNGSATELVLADSGNMLHVLHWDGVKSSIGLQIQRDGVIYCAPHVHSSVLTAVRFLRGLAEYGKRTELFWSLAGLFRRYARASPEAAAFLAYIVILTWFPEVDPGNHGVYHGRGAAASFATFSAVPRSLPTSSRRGRTHPSLAPFFASDADAEYRPDVSEDRGFLAGFELSRRVRCRRQGRGEQYRLRKDNFLREDGGSGNLGPGGHEPQLAAHHRGASSLTEREAAALAAEYQRKCLMLRLRVLVPKDQPNTTSGSSLPELTGFGVRRHLPLFLQEEPEIVKAVIPLLEAHEQELPALRSLDPLVAIVESLWSAAHKEKEIAVKELAVKELRFPPTAKNSWAGNCET